MNAIRTVYNDIPKTIEIPAEYIHKSGEVIILVDETVDELKNQKPLSDFLGVLPDFPERGEQGDYTEWRKDLFKDMSVKELSHKAMDYINK